MIFRNYGEDNATLKEWSRQLNVATQNKMIFRMYDNPEATVSQWSILLNQLDDTIVFPTYTTATQTIMAWERKLNNLFKNEVKINADNE